MSLSVFAHCADDSLHDRFRRRDLARAALDPTHLHHSLNERALQILQWEFKGGGFDDVVCAHSLNLAMLSLQKSASQRRVGFRGQCLSEMNKRRHVMDLIEGYRPLLRDALHKRDSDRRATDQR